MQRLPLEVSAVLFMHEVHHVRGRTEDAFEAAYREGWMPLLAAGEDARLLWYANHAHGSGPAYTVVTVTAVRDGASWERLALRIQQGDLRQWMRDLDELRYDVDAKLLVPLDWSPIRDVDFDEVPVDGREHELTLYMEDTMWPFPNRVGEYIERCGEVYSKSLDRPNPLLTIEAAFQPALGSQRRREVSLMQRIHDPRALLRLLQTDIPPEYRGPGTWMHDALELRDQWTSRLLRTSSWSPLH
ncbi:hypothetical protein GGC64_002561 [Mycobacterium sp. OAS707]|uniref:hypothetical protein n=1 Tax=Mycobacterium sp. OAS707 TaxID=2663822 RepID=UPI0019FE2C40|nr:hypothetical protein [Mycobacterium sp. OAS707]MBE1548537.1 hypothetical protein [Mycobacterium sp. OAS707]